LKLLNEISEEVLKDIESEEEKNEVGRSLKRVPSGPISKNIDEKAEKNPELWGEPKKKTTGKNEPIINENSEKNNVLWDEKKQPKPTAKSTYIRQSSNVGPGSANFVSKSEPVVLNPVVDENFQPDKTLPYSVLTKRPLPSDVDSNNLEAYLSPEEFKQVFKMDRESFKGLQVWKKKELKKNAKLF